MANELLDALADGVSSPAWKEAFHQRSEAELKRYADRMRKEGASDKDIDANVSHWRGQLNQDIDWRSVRQETRDKADKRLQDFHDTNDQLEGKNTQRYQFTKDAIVDGHLIKKGTDITVVNGHVTSYGAGVGGTEGAAHLKTLSEEQIAGMVEEKRSILRQERTPRETRDIENAVDRYSKIVGMDAGKTQEWKDYLRDTPGDIARQTQDWHAAAAAAEYYRHKFDEEMYRQGIDPDKEWKRRVGTEGSLEQRMAAGYATADEINKGYGKIEGSIEERKDFDLAVDKYAHATGMDKSDAKWWKDYVHDKPGDLKAQAEIWKEAGDAARSYRQNFNALMEAKGLNAEEEWKKRVNTEGSLEQKIVKGTATTAEIKKAAPTDFDIDLERARLKEKQAGLDVGQSAPEPVKPEAPKVAGSQASDILGKEAGERGPILTYQSGEKGQELTIDLNKLPKEEQDRVRAQVYANADAAGLRDRITETPDKIVVNVADLTVEQQRALNALKERQEKGETQGPSTQPVPARPVTVPVPEPEPEKPIIHPKKAYEILETELGKVGGKNWEYKADLAFGRSRKMSVEVPFEERETQLKDTQSKLKAAGISPDRCSIDVDGKLTVDLKDLTEDEKTKLATLQAKHQNGKGEEPEQKPASPIPPEPEQGPTKPANAGEAQAQPDPEKVPARPISADGQVKPAVPIDAPKAGEIIGNTLGKFEGKDWSYDPDGFGKGNPTISVEVGKLSYQELEAMGEKLKASAKAAGLPDSVARGSSYNEKTGRVQIRLDHLSDKDLEALAKLQQAQQAEKAGQKPVPATEVEGKLERVPPTPPETTVPPKAEKLDDYNARMEAERLAKVPKAEKLDDYNKRMEEKGKLERVPPTPPELTTPPKAEKLDDYNKRMAAERQSKSSTEEAGPAETSGFKPKGPVQPDGPPVAGRIVARAVDEDGKQVYVRKNKDNNELTASYDLAGRNPVAAGAIVEITAVKVANEGLAKGQSFDVQEGSHTGQLSAPPGGKGTSERAAGR